MWQSRIAYVGIGCALDQGRRCCEGRINRATRRKTARYLNVHSRQKNGSSNAVPDSAIHIGKHTDSKGSESVGDGCRGRELHAGEEVDRVSCSRNDDHGGHLLIFGLY